MKRHRRDYEMMADMNLTNLLDTAFVLLIAFIMASPTMRTGLKINLPEVKDSEVINTQQQSKPVVITIRKMTDMPGAPEWLYTDGENRKSLDPADPTSLKSYIQAKKSMYTNQKIEVVVESDKEARYDVLAQVLSILRSEGIESIGLSMTAETAAPASGAAKKSNTVKKTSS